MTIDMNELRLLAQAATPGPWHLHQDGLNHGFPRGVMEINAGDWQAFAGAWAISGGKPSEEGAANAAFIAAANPATVIELLDLLEAAEEDRDTLRAEVESWKGLAQQFGNEADALRAKIEAMEKQEPIGEMREVSPLNWELCWFRSVPFGAKLFTSPCAKGE